MFGATTTNTPTKGCSETTYLKDRESLPLPAGFIKASSETTGSMGEESIDGQMGGGMKGVTRMI